MRARRQQIVAGRRWWPPSAGPRSVCAPGAAAPGGPVLGPRRPACLGRALASPIVAADRLPASAMRGPSSADHLRGAES
jgi:hypothetical protein